MGVKSCTIQPQAPKLSKCPFQYLKSFVFSSKILCKMKKNGIHLIMQSAKSAFHHKGKVQVVKRRFTQHPQAAGAEAEVS